MALKTGDKVTIDDVINAVNTNVKNVIQNKIQWWRGGGYPAKLSSNYIYQLKNTKVLPDLAQSGRFSRGQIITWTDFFAKIQALFISWVAVRYVHYTRYAYGNANGGTAPLNQTANTSGYAIISEIDPNVLNNITGIDYTGTILSPSSINNLTSKLYNTWAALGTIEWSYTDPCHTNCHSNCHGSGGYR